MRSSARRRDSEASLLSLKPGVSVRGVGTEMCTAIVIVNGIYANRGYPCVITSCVEGDHSRGSEHYKGDAADFRTRHMNEEVKLAVHLECRQALGAEYDVVLEGDHLHIEFDPKAPV